MAIAKLLLLIGATIAQQYAITAPNVRPPNEQLREQRGVEHVLSYITTSVRTQIWSWASIEGSVLFAQSSYCPPALARPLFRALFPSLSPSLAGTTLASFTTPTPAFLVGTLLSIAGGLLRAHCFRALDTSFTFQLSIRPSHKLVTDGIYSIVRHPSYTGAIALAAGWFLCVLDPQGSVVSVCTAWAQTLTGRGGGRDTSGDALVMAVITCLWVTFLWMFVSKQMDKEDAMLEKNFGEEWRAWAKRVPYRLIPGVY